jgi:predicted N-acetyltransferase YhbS
MNTKVEIEYLVDCQEHVDSLAELWYQEISRHWVADTSIEKAKSRLISHLNTDSVPLAVVAVQDGNPIGMACLRETDGIRPGITPWLGSLVVSPDSRQAKVGETLIEAIKAKAKLLKYETLYLLAFDPTIPNWYAKLGWQIIGYDELFGHRVTVMSIPL